MVGFDAHFFWVCASPFDFVFEWHYFTRLGFSSRLSFVFGSSVLRVFLSRLRRSSTVILSALSVSVPANSGRDHLPMSSRILAAGVSSALSSLALKVASNVRFVWYVLALMSTVVDIFLPARARRMRFLNCVATSVEPETVIFASVMVLIPSRRLHLSRSSSWTFRGAGSKGSHSFGMVSVVHGFRVGSSGVFPH